MKFSAALFLTLACAAGLAAQTGTGASGPKTPRITLPSDPTPAAKAEAEAKAKAAAAGKTPKKEEPPAKIEGMEIPRGKGFLGIQIVDATFKLSFYDEKKKPVAADMDRAALRWDAKYKVGEERVVLNPGGDGKSLTSPRNIRPPYNFKLFLTLIKDATESQAAASESFVIDFRQ